MTYTLITPGGAQFDSLRNAFNQRWSAPDLKAVYICSSGTDVVDALNNAVHAFDAQPGDVRILGGGHCYENFVYNSETKVIIDVTGIKTLTADDDADTITVGAGYTNWEIARLLFKNFNLQLPAGSCYSVGLGGHVTGGGYGLSSRACGLTVDYISAFEIAVYSQASKGFKLIHANAKNNPDLCWALRGGGGGNFGVITEYTFKSLPDAFKNADIFVVAINWDDIGSSRTLKSIMGVYADYCANVGASADISDRQWSSNIFALGKFAHKSQGQIAFVIQSAWNENAEQDVQTRQVKNFVNDLDGISGVSPTRLRSQTAGYPTLVPGLFGPPSIGKFDITAPYAAQSMSWIDATMTNNGSGANQRGCYNSVYFRTMLTDVQLQKMYDYLSGGHDIDGLDYSQTLLQIDSYGGKINEYHGGDTSIRQRSSIMKGQFQIYWNDGYQNDLDRDSDYVGWLDNFFRDMFAETGGFPNPRYKPPAGGASPTDAKASVDGCYVNYPNRNLGTNGGTPDIEHALHLYFSLGITKKLVKVKAAFDSRNWFRHAQSVPVSLTDTAV